METPTSRVSDKIPSHDDGFCPSMTRRQSRRAVERAVSIHPALISNSDTIHHSLARNREPAGQMSLVGGSGVGRGFLREDPMIRRVKFCIKENCIIRLPNLGARSGELCVCKANWHSSHTNNNRQTCQQPNHASPRYHSTGHLPNQENIAERASEVYLFPPGRGSVRVLAGLRSSEERRNEEGRERERGR